MRSTVRRAYAPLVSLAPLALVSALSSSARAEATESRVVTRAASNAPWLHIADVSHRLKTLAPRAAFTELEPAARAALRQVRPASDNASFGPATTHRFRDGGAIVHFEQTHRGLPVIGRGATVRLTSAKETLLTAVDVEDDLPASTIAGLSASLAAEIAASRIAMGTSEASDAHLAVWPMLGGGSRLAYVVLPRVPAGMPYVPRVVVDAQSGEVIEMRNIVQFETPNELDATGPTASVYRSNPLKSPTLESITLPMAPDASAGGKLTNDFVMASNCIDKKKVKTLDVGQSLTLHVCDLEQVATADTDGRYVYAPIDDPSDVASRSDAFSELSMYYHATKAYTFFRDLQGDPNAQVVVDKPLRVVANLQMPAGIFRQDLLSAANPEKALEPFQNAFFAPGGQGGLGSIFAQLYGVTGGALWFGQGPRRDYAYDGDVVYHEFTHAVIENTLALGGWHVDARGAIDAPGAMNEGLADYFSSAITGDPDVGEYASKDIDANLNVIRSLANKDACPTAIAGEVHFDSTLFSGALWQARTALPEGDRSKFDAGLYKAMRTNPGRGDLGFSDLANLFSATLATDFPAGKAALEAAMTARGILPACERIVDFNDKPVTSPFQPPPPNVGGFAAPGTNAGSFGKVAPGIIQVHAKGADIAKGVVQFKTPKARAAAPGGFGSQGTPFTALVLVKFGAPITWKSGSKGLTHDANLKLKADGTTTQTATFDAPEGATDVYVQIANTGESDGIYDGVSIELTPRVIAPKVPDSTVATAVPDDKGSCSTPGQRPIRGSLASFAAVGAFAIAAAFRRRQRRSS
jgi:hypothetical protein